MNQATPWTRRGFAAALLALSSLAAAGAVRAEEVLRLVVPFAAGSYTDNVARLVAPGLAQHLGKNVIVENRAGANGIIGADFVARAKPDGLTLLVGGASVNTINPGVYKNLPYDPQRDLLPVARIGILPFMLLVNMDLPVRSVAELVQYAKAHPEKLSYGTPNAATLVGTETFKRGAGISLLSIPYKSSPQAMTDLVGNQIQVLMADFATAMPQVQAGKARLLAVTMKDRSALLPDTPPISDTVPGFDLSAWTGLLAPGKTPPEVVQPIYDALRASLADPALQAKFKNIGFDIDPMGPAEFGPYIHDEIDKWKALAREAGIEPQ
ncbi:tripartite tricarboxylate transporter substrate binding protein [Bordetella sp. BOR01]|uniref:Bug family tripartite tricarboxylate transporter substrate binding protein n=1 Tax=Bordetella sp. BOR01 TaxID=2854779 RepID=UPI001C452796|nr:tripartite tricarboxylate transporter substrate binding protein [Bordetella sp. BOR01]MBV7484811.1 tripartite tricarboxylate transporter substrate binding protein [Bordetella sp. BOR01]